MYEWLLFTCHVPQIQNCIKMQFCENCKRCLAKRVAMNGVNSTTTSEME